MNHIETEMHLANIEAEKIVLGSIFIEPELIKDCYLKPENFFDPRHGNLLYILQDLDEKNVPLEITAIAERLGSKIDRVGGLTYLMEIAAFTPTTANFRFYQTVIVDYYQKRRQYEIGRKLQSSTLEAENPAQVREEIIEELVKLDENVDGDEDDGHIGKALYDLYEWFETDHGEITGAETGFNDLDRMTNGFQREDLIIVAARPSVGKTAFALNLAENISSKGKPTGIFSLEMAKAKLLTRMISSHSTIDATLMRNPMKNFDSEHWSKTTFAMADLSNKPMHIYDDSSVDVGYIRRKCRSLVKRYPGQHLVIIIDYLQLIVGDPKFGGNRTQEIGHISRQLKIMAREFKMTIIALSQLSRGVENRQDKRPMMSDIRESGNIEQDADVIIFLYRDDYYDRESEQKNMIEVIIAKQRNGPTGTVTLAFKKEFNKFINIDWSQRQHG